MSNQSHSRMLRQLAEEIMDQIASRIDVSDTERKDWLTSLLRQWISYDGQAALFFQGRQVQFTLQYTPLGKPYCNPRPIHPDWAPALVERFNIHPENLLEAFDQLNRCQTADVVDREGKLVRLSIDPKEGRRGIETLTKEAVPANKPWDYQDAAARALRACFEGALAQDEVDLLACSLMRQWNKYGGVAALFVPGEQLLFFLEVDDQHCGVRRKRRPADVETALRAMGFAPNTVPDVLARLNLDQEISFQDRHGHPAILWHDLKSERLWVKEVGQDPIPQAIASGPIFCRRCSAVLTPGPTGDVLAICPNCGPV